MESDAKRMKVFYVGDNRTALNWGRGASIALAQLAYPAPSRSPGELAVTFSFWTRPRLVM